jgi:hypothetical protein
MVKILLQRLCLVELYRPETRELDASWALPGCMWGKIFTFE